MLQAIRERAQGWIAWVIVILISIPFALWGIQEYLGVGAEPVVATVDGQEVTERDLDTRFQRFRSELRERLGSAYRPEMFDDQTLRREVLDDMIRTQLVLQASTDMGLRAGDDQVRATILAVPAFQRDGRFDIASYEQALRFQGLSQAQFEHSVRASLLTAQLSRVITSSELTTPAEANDAARLRRQKREIGWIMLPLERFTSSDPIPDSELDAYYQENAEVFRTPEQVKVEYLVLAHGAAGATREPSEAELQQLYESRRETLAQREQRRARHILITVDQGADSATADEAKRRIDAASARLRAGEDFGVLANELSQDPGSAAQGGDLGFFEKGLMDPAFEQAVFSMEQGQVSEPVRTRFGYHLIEVTGVQAERVPTLDEVRDELTQAARTTDAEHRYFEQAEQLGNLAYEHPDSLVPAAEALGLQIQKSDWIDRSGGEGVLANAKLLASVFSPEAVKQGFNSELIEVQDDAGQKAVVARVADHREASLKPFDEVRDQVTQALRARQARAAAEAAAARMVERLRGGESLSQVAGDSAVQTSGGLVSRNASAVPAPVLSSAFTLPRAAGGSGSFGATSLPDGSAVVVVVTRVEDGSVEGLSKELRDQETQALARGRARQYYDHLVTDLRARADVEYRKVEREGSVLNE